MEWVGFVVFMIAAAAAVYYVPAYLGRDEDPMEEEQSSGDLFASSVKVVHDGAEDDGQAEVSTPEGRRRQVEAIRESEHRAAQRRQRVLVVIVLMFIAAVGLSAISEISWWWTALPVGLFVMFAVAARIGVTRMRAHHDRIMQQLRDGGTEKTVGLRRPISVDEDTATRDVQLGEPPAGNAGLWGPVAVTKDTYVQQPLGPRTVRTIDLSAPDAQSWETIPPTADPRPGADAPVVENLDEPSIRRAVGE